MASPFSRRTRSKGSAWSGSRAKSPVAALLASAALALALANGAKAQDGAIPSKAMASLLADYDVFDRRSDPLSAGGDGDRAALSQLPDDSLQAQAVQQRSLEGFLDRLRALSVQSFSIEDRLNQEFLTRLIEETLEGLKLDVSRINFDAYSGFHLTPAEIAQGAQIRDRDDAECYLSRLSGLQSYYETEIENARRGVRTHFTQPASTTQIVIAIVRNQVDRPAADDPLLVPLSNLPNSIPAVDRLAFQARALRLVTASIKPEQARLLRFLQETYLPNARKSLAVRDLPNGEAYYLWSVRRHTTTEMTPDQIHALGVREVARIRQAMEAAVRASGFTGSFSSFLSFLRTDPQFYARSKTALLEKAALFNKRVDDQLPKSFGRLPRLPFAVREIPRESEESATTAYYEPGSPALGVAGGFMVNTSHLDQRPLYELPVLAMHESEPGHHLQIALAQELTDLPRFRRNADITAYVEGWALYAEQLADEMGLHLTPYEQFGQLSYEMWRACRLVADTGIHWLRWSRDEARQCFSDNTALAPKNIEVELDRYIGWPGQALAYKIGELKFIELRRRAETRLGTSFDIRAFHDAVLLRGPLPLDLLEAQVERWLASQGVEAGGRNGSTP